MPKNSDNSWSSEKEYDLEQVMDPDFRLESITDGSDCSKNLYMQVFEQVPQSISKWRSLPVERWHLLASISKARITM